MLLLCNKCLVCFHVLKNNDKSYDSITGRCTQHPSLFYGDECQLYSCPKHCLDLNSDQTTGSCKDGYQGKHCQLESTTPTMITGLNNDNKNGHRSKCHIQLHNLEGRGWFSLKNTCYIILSFVLLFSGMYIHYNVYSSPMYAL